MLAVWRWWCDEQVWGESKTTSGATQGWADLNYSVFNSSHLKPSVPLGSSSTEKTLPSCGQSDTVFLAVALPSSSPRGLRLVWLWTNQIGTFSRQICKTLTSHWCSVQTQKDLGRLVGWANFISIFKIFFFPLRKKKKQLPLNVTEVTRKMRKWPSDSPPPPRRPAAAEITACVH